MRILLVTEKANTTTDQRDGGARLVETLRRAFGDAIAVDVLQFGGIATDSSLWQVHYPHHGGDRFARRLANADFIAQEVRARLDRHAHVVFVHVSMQFGLVRQPLRGPVVWTMPMFLTPSYQSSGESVPAEYTEREHQVLQCAENVLTPSRFERQQLVEVYGVDPNRIRVMPRGIDLPGARPSIRGWNGILRLCSIGSIKPQKNTVGLVRLFAAVRRRIPGATLRIIGPVQDRAYLDLVHREVADCNVEDSVEFLGYVSPSELASATASCHLHLSASNCETFGRAIFESLALGLPNVVRKDNNAALEHLADRPYVRTFNTEIEGADAVCSMLPALGRLSELAAEVGGLFDDKLLAARLAAELVCDSAMVVTDFDGTLFHKGEPDRTLRSVAAFMRYQRRVVCSARALPDLLRAMNEIGASADYVVALGGAVVATGTGEVLNHVALDSEAVASVRRAMPTAVSSVNWGRVSQFVVPKQCLVSLEGLRVETYQSMAYVTAWQASKLHATVWLLRHIGWRGRVRAFGDGRYDEDLLRYFDGTQITPQPSDIAGCRQASEVTDD